MGRGVGERASVVQGVSQLGSMMAKSTEKAWTAAMHASAAEGHGWDAAASERQRLRLLAMLAADDALLVSPHFPAPGMGLVARRASGSEAEVESGGGGGFEYAPLAQRTAGEAAACKPCDAWGDGDWAVREAG